ncbi:hypothetical protein C8Q79DRAFT_736808 [Trametes meyenii]|nr:hypothetical protein C8Q79DRAFT_736808 [Trametes meyenii]
MTPQRDPSASRVSSRRSTRRSPSPASTARTLRTSQKCWATTTSTAAMITPRTRMRMRTRLSFPVTSFGISTCSTPLWSMLSKSWSLLSPLQLLVLLAFFAFLVVLLVDSLGHRFFWAPDLLSSFLWGFLFVIDRCSWPRPCSLKYTYKPHNVLCPGNYIPKPTTYLFIHIDIIRITNVDSFDSCATLLTLHGDDTTLYDTGLLGDDVCNLRAPLLGKALGGDCL